MNVVLDLGANIECNDQNLIDFAELGSALFKSLFPNEKPKVALLNVGSEEIKGTETLKNASRRLKDLSGEENFIYRFGFVPANFSFIAIFTSMFLHGGFSHIMGNMWFLWVFGDNVEGVLGHAKYALFYILCGLAATISQLLINPESSIPMVGASGAIAGVLGMYMIRFPNANVHVFAFIIIFFARLISACLST